MSQSDPGFRSGFFYQVGLAVPCTRSTKYMAYNIGCHSCSLFYLYCLLSVDASEHLVYFILDQGNQGTLLTVYEVLVLVPVISCSNTITDITGCSITYVP